MKIIAAAIAYLLLILSLNTPAMALQINGNAYILTDAEVRICATGGGCVVIPVMQLKDDIFKLQEAAWSEGAKHGSRAGYEAGFAAGMSAKAKGST